MTIRSIEAEQAVIGSILIDARCLDSVAQLLRPQDFGMEINRAMYRVILSMDREGRKIDPVTVKEVALQAGAEIPSENSWSSISLRFFSMPVEMLCTPMR
jgi:replicative DNA helicase